jgi:hypothetical protein
LSLSDASGSVATRAIKSEITIMAAIIGW